MRHIIQFLMIIVLTWGGISPMSDAQTASDNLLLFANERGIWYMDTEQVPQLWLAHSPTAYWWLMNAINRDSILLYNQVDDGLYWGQFGQQPSEFTRLANINPQFGVAITSDQSAVIYASGTPVTWYQMSLSNLRVSTIYEQPTVLACGSGVYQPDTTEYRNRTESFFMALRHDDVILTNITCSGGLRSIDMVIPDIYDADNTAEATPVIVGEPVRIIQADLHPTDISPNHRQVVGTLADSIAVIDATTGDIMAYHISLTGYDRAWWLDEDSILFTTVTLKDPYFPIQFAPSSAAVRLPMWDETLADMMFNGWSIAARGLDIYELAIYQWNLTDNQHTLLWQGSAYRGVSDVVVQSDNTIWLEIIPSALPLVQAIEQNMGYDVAQALYPHPRLIPLVDGQLQDTSYFIGHSIILVGG